MRRAAGSILGAALALTLAGCAQTVDGKVSGALPHLSTPVPTTSAPPTTAAPTTSTPAPPPTTSSTPAPPTTSAPKPKPVAWVNIKDGHTGIRFQLPGHPKTKGSDGTAGDGTPIHTAQYQVDGQFGSGVIVGITSGKGTTISARRAKFGSVGNSIVAELKSQGQGNPRLFQKRKTKVRGDYALCYRIRFTPKEAVQAEPGWRVCEIDAGTSIVTTQVIESGFAGQQQALLATATAVEKRLLGSFRFP